MANIDDVFKQYLIESGWIDKGYVFVKYQNPRLGLTKDGILIIGYFEYPEEIVSIKMLRDVLSCADLIISLSSSKTVTRDNIEIIYKIYRVYYHHDLIK